MAITIIGHNLVQLTAVGDQIPAVGTAIGIPPRLPREELWIVGISLICKTTGLFELQDVNLDPAITTGNIILHETVTVGDTGRFTSGDGPGKYVGVHVTALPANSSIILELK